MEDTEKSKIATTIAGLKTNIAQYKKQIESSDEMIKTQDNDIARLKYVISEAEAEKQKALKRKAEREGQYKFTQARFPHVPSF